VLILRTESSFSPLDVASLAFGPDNSTLFAEHFYHPYGVRVWNLVDQTHRPLMSGGRLVSGPFALHPGGRWAFGMIDRSASPPAAPARAFDLVTGTAVPFYMAAWPGRQIGVSALGRIASAGYTSHDPERPTGSGRQRLYNWALTDTGPECVWYRDLGPEVGAWLVGFVGDRFVSATIHGNMPRLEVHGPTGEIEATLDVRQFPPQQMLASPDGRWLVYRLGTELRVWDATDWNKPPIEVAGKLKQTMLAAAACFHPSAPFLLMANDGPSVLVFDTTTWKQVRKWKWSEGALRAVGVSPDGSLAAAAGPRGAIHVWDLDL
jgi:WD40 repeat protein